jgi:hypothetical protein
VSNLHPCFANIAWLKRAKSRKPMPPEHFGVDSHTQDLQCIFFFPFSTPHHLLAINVFNFSHVANGSSKQLMTKVGIAYVIALIKASFPALDNGLSARLQIYLQILSYRNLKVAVGDRPTEVGMPR